MSVLDDIIAGVKQRLEVRQAQVSLEEIKDRASQATPAKDALAALSGGASALPVIAEIKRASPSKGRLSEIPDPAALAQIYAAGGAAMISVLTEELRFHGSLQDLATVRAAVDIPILRKDFIVTPYQVYEARAYGADAILLIVAALSQEKLVSLLECATSLGMVPLVETHSRTEVARAIAAGAKLIGVNARNLKTLTVDKKVVEQVIDAIPKDAIAVAESGVSNSQDVLNYALAGADAVLIGEALVTSKSPQERIKEMVNVGLDPTWLTKRKQRTIV